MDHNNRSVVVQQPIIPARNLSQHGLPYMPPGCSNQKFQGKETKVNKAENAIQPEDDESARQC